MQLLYYDLHPQFPDRFCCLPIDSFWGGYSPWPKWVNAPFKELKSRVPGKIQDPVYTRDDLYSFYRDFAGAGGAVTFNLGITADGRLNERSIELVRSLKK